MRIAQPVITQTGCVGWLVYSPDGELIAMIQRQPGPPVALKSIIGPHVLLSQAPTVTVTCWTRLVAQVPGGEGLC